MQTNWVWFWLNNKMTINFSTRLDGKDPYPPMETSLLPLQSYNVKIVPAYLK